jgi:citrate synthase
LTCCAEITAMVSSVSSLHYVRQNNMETKNKKTIKVIDNQTGQELTLEVNNNTIRAVDLAKLGVTVYDPGFLNTASCISRITYIDGDKGILRYRGYPIEELAEKSSFMEVSFLLLYGELPTSRELEHFTHRVLRHTFVKQSLVDIIKATPKDAHPMGTLVSMLAAEGTLYPDANPAINGGDIYNSPMIREKQILRLLGTMPTLAAFIYRHKVGRPFNYPAYGGSRSYTENFMYMLDSMDDPSYRPNSTLVKALDTLFVLHADHELNCSTAAVRHLTSSGVDVFTAFSGAAGALYGPLHGGANEAVLRMLEKIGSVNNVPAFIEAVKNRKALLMGFGHRVYKNYDPRARIVRKLAYQVFEICGKDPLIEIATTLEEHALKDKYFIERKLYPNVDFYSGLIYKAMGFPTDFFTILFAIGRTPGWLAHWLEYLDDPDRKIARPRQNYLGSEERSYIPMTQRNSSGKYSTEYVSPAEKRRVNGFAVTSKM